MAVAAGDISLGHHGLIRTGQTIPESYIDSVGAEIKTDFKRLEALGLVEVEKVKRAAKDAVAAVEHDLKG